MKNLALAVFCCAFTLLGSAAMAQGSGGWMLLEQNGTTSFGDSYSKRQDDRTGEIYWVNGANNTAWPGTYITVYQVAAPTALSSFKQRVDAKNAEERYLRGVMGNYTFDYTYLPWIRSRSSLTNEQAVAYAVSLGFTATEGNSIYNVWTNHASAVSLYNYLKTKAVVY